MTTLSHYIDLKLRADPELPAEQLMASLFHRLHLALVQLRCGDLAVSFPGHVCQPTPTLGNTLRLLAPAERLSSMSASDWLGGMRDHVVTSALLPVPATASAVRLERVQAKTSIDRLRRRAMKRHGLTEAQARARLPASAADARPDLPRLTLRSSSTGSRYELFLRLRSVERACAGNFNTFGLSAEATVPWF